MIKGFIPTCNIHFCISVLEHNMLTDIHLSLQSVSGENDSDNYFLSEGFAVTHSFKSNP